MQFNQEGVNQRGDQFSQGQQQQCQQEEFNPQSFQKQRTIGQVSNSFQRRLTEREKNNVKGHVFLEPKWNNSFHLETPILGVITLIILAIYFCFLFSGRIEADKDKLIYGSIALILYIIECCTNGVVGYLRNQMSVRELQNYLNEIKQMNFELKFNVSSYHYQYRSHYDSEKKRNVRSQETVYTYNETFEYPVGQTVDETEDSTVFFEKAKYFRIHSFVTYSFGDQQSARYYDDMIKLARNKAKSRDTFQSESEDQNCQGLKTTLLAYQDGVKLDPMLSVPVYIIYCLVGLSLLYRILLNQRVSFLEHCVHKKVYMDLNKVNPEVYQFEMVRQNVQYQQIIMNNQAQIINQQQQILQQQQQGILNQNMQQPLQPNYNYPQQPINDVPNPMN
ncbi:transmembrane protein, putative (macronuclear) [Tetrahymena thermophila SB210]|uniref:Transmembrane protein, putative n=1 Tax=Tetrahymena thermophila (strain SB210) TaxID=312017 RepID=Q230W3_TETTS|nr:transmembrane protein, putative [Tetrahymena thermophila SB210]EAR91176.2 transmembrane protein, putative [Tetrahymena thermophila SB210]|eukprot:XP_001011421.2 transmembrane protein, putative [Tetrahymena thermophila SB210]